VLPLLRAGQAGPAHTGIDRPVYSETDYPRHAFGWSALASWRAEQFLFVRAPTRELYDVNADPQSTRNIAESRTRVADGVDAELLQFIRRTAAGTTDREREGSAERRVDPALTERLAALGYVGGSGGAKTSTRIDPKDRIQVANALQAAISAVEDGQFSRAIPLLEHVVATEPSIPIAQLNLGVAYARTKQHGKAVAALEKATTLDPESSLGRYELASALYETGDLRRAADQFAVVAARMPRWADARYSLGAVYARIDRVADALTELSAAIALEPRHFRANLLLGRIQTLQGRAADAVPHLQTAVEAQPDNAEAHEFLADAYEKTGDARGAASERERARALKRK